MRLNINGIPVELTRVGDRWEARVGIFGLVKVHGATSQDAMAQVAVLVSMPNFAAA